MVSKFNFILIGSIIPDPIFQMSWVFSFLAAYR